MRYSLLLTGLAIAQFSLAQTEQFAYAITDVTKEGVSWNVLRKMDLQKGSYSDVLLNGADVNTLSFDAASKKQLTTPLSDARYGNLVNAQFGTGVAAMAYDKKSNRLYYTPMFFDQLRYVDLKTMQVYFINNDFTGAKEKKPDQSNIITRMTFASDGDGYAVSNDGKNLVRFTTGKKSTITNLGELTDDEANTQSIHDVNSFGGDMIADNDGNLFIFSAHNSVFRVNILSRKATYLGTIAGLPTGFTSNGAAVIDDQHIFICSATDLSGGYSVNAETWSASPVNNQSSWRTSDLANSNLLVTKKPTLLTDYMVRKPIEETVLIEVYPNPVTNNQFSLQFNTKTAANYTIQVADAAGKRARSPYPVSVSGKAQNETIQLAPSLKKGLYVVSVIDANNKTVFTKKIIVQ